MSGLKGFVRTPGADARTRRNFNSLAQEALFITNSSTLELTDGVMEVQDLFLRNDASDTTVGVITMLGFAVNPDGADQDSYIEGDTDENLFYVDAGTDRVGIGIATPATKLDIAGELSAKNFTINEAGDDLDCRIEGDAEQNLFYTDAGNDRVGIGTAIPATKLDVAGVLSASDVIVSDGGTVGQVAGPLLTFNDTTNLLTISGGDVKVDGDIQIADAKFLIFDKASGNGIKVDTATPSFGWRDLLGKITNAGGANKPTRATYRGGIDQFRFGAGDESVVEFHIPHDYIKGTDIHLHIHWSHISTIVTGGTLTFTAESSYAKGHNQAAFSAPALGTFTGTASTTQYQQIISEIQLSASSPAGLQIDTDDLEPDGVILMRLEMTTNNITSSGTVPDPFIHFIDIHYQTTNIGTKEKAPDFYA